MRTRRVCVTRSSTPSFRTYCARARRGRGGSGPAQRFSLGGGEARGAGRRPTRRQRGREALIEAGAPAPGQAQAAPRRAGSRPPFRGPGPRLLAHLDEHQVRQRVEVMLEAQRHEGRGRRGHAAGVEFKLGGGDRAAHPFGGQREPIGHALLRRAWPVRGQQARAAGAARVAAAGLRSVDASALAATGERLSVQPLMLCIFGARPPRSRLAAALRRALARHTHHGHSLWSRPRLPL